MFASARRSFNFRLRLWRCHFGLSLWRRGSGLWLWPRSLRRGLRAFDCLTWLRLWLCLHLRPLDWTRRRSRSLLDDLPSLWRLLNTRRWLWLRPRPDLWWRLLPHGWLIRLPARLYLLLPHGALLLLRGSRLLTRGLS